MAIKVGGTTVVDDSRNICNVANVCATTYYGSGASLTGVGEPSYICAVACTDIAAGIPVGSNACGVSCLTALPLNQLDATICACYGPSGGGTADGAILKFCCSENCFASISVCGKACDQNAYLYCLKTHCVSPSGLISSACLCCVVIEAASVCAGRYRGLNTKLFPVASCEGNISQVAWSDFSCDCCAPYAYTGNCCAVRLCFCTTTNVISLVCACSVSYNCTSDCDVYKFITPDDCYLIGWCVAGANGTCASITMNMSVRTNNNSVCLLTYPASTNVCGCPLKSILPATCAIYSGSDTDMSLPYPQGFSYGADGWMLIHPNVLCCNSVAPGCERQQKLMAIRPVGDRCFQVTCNIICPGCGGAGDTFGIPFCCSSGCQWCASACFTNIGMIFDQGDNVKREVYVICCSVNPGTGTGPMNSILTCFCVNPTTSNLIFLGNVVNTAAESGCNYRQNWPLGCFSASMPSSRITINNPAYTPKTAQLLYSMRVPCRYGNGCHLMRVADHMITGCGVTCGIGAGRTSDCTGNGETAYMKVMKFCAPNPFPLGSAVARVLCTPLCSGKTHGSMAQTYCGCPAIQEHYSQLFQSGTVGVDYGNGHSAVSSQYNGNCAGRLVLQAYTQTISDTVCCFVGISQNCSAKGGIVCYAVPGMQDRSNFANTYFNACALACCVICIGWSTPANAQIPTMATIFGTTGATQFNKYGYGPITFNMTYDYAANTWYNMIQSDRGSRCGA